MSVDLAVNTPMEKKTFLKIFDIPVIAIAIMLTITLGLASYSGGAGSSRVIIRGPEKTWIYPLDAEEELKVEGPIGVTTVKIHQGRAAIVSSPCPGQTCVAAGAVYKNGQWAACLPNRVFLLVEAADGGDGVDASSW